MTWWMWMLAGGVVWVALCDIARLIEKELGRSSTRSDRSFRRRVIWPLVFFAKPCLVGWRVIKFRRTEKQKKITNIEQLQQEVLNLQQKLEAMEKEKKGDTNA